MNWQTFHTQGLVKVGRTFYVSAVEVVESTVRNGTVTDALYDFSIDRSAGAGRGWLFKFDDTGDLLDQVELTRAAPIPHPLDAPNHSRLADCATQNAMKPGKG